jgi:KaiC/GvpD/RAD55 family RecA-like ATPase
MEDNLEFKEEKRNMDRVKTGVKGLDELIQGGFPKGSNIVVTGAPGSGKSIFAMNYIAQGCKNGEKCLYIAVDQIPDDIVEQAMLFNWNFNQWENEGLVKFVHLNHRSLSEMNTYNELRRLIQENHYDRLVIDSTTSITDSPPSINDLVDGADRGLQPSAFTMMNRANVMQLFEITKKHGTTTVSISQKVEGKPGDTIDNVSEFIGDGLILMNATEMGDYLERTIRVKKLRKTKIDGISHPFKFTDIGISLKSKDV